MLVTGKITHSLCSCLLAIQNSASVVSTFNGMSLGLYNSKRFVCSAVSVPRTVAHQAPRHRQSHCRRTEATRHFYLPCVSDIRLCESSRHPTKGKHHFYICQNGFLKFCRINGENPDKIGAFTGYIYFVALLCLKRAKRSKIEVKAKKRPT